MQVRVDLLAPPQSEVTFVFDRLPLVRFAYTFIFNKSLTLWCTRKKQTVMPRTTISCNAQQYTQHLLPDQEKKQQSTHALGDRHGSARMRAKSAGGSALNMARYPATVLTPRLDSKSN